MSASQKPSLLQKLPLVDTIHNRRSYQKFAHDHDLVYFGDVSQFDDDHELVRGFSLTTRHRDHHYCVGTHDGYDVIVLQRTDTLSYPGHPNVHHTWNIVQVDLREHIDESHVLIDSAQHSEVFYQNIFSKFNRLTLIDSMNFADYDDTFRRNFRVYTPPDNIDRVSQLLSPDIAAYHAHQARHLDVEWYQDRLLTYSAKPIVTQSDLSKQLAHTIWFAKSFEAVHRII